jgi:hypothetical protein
MSQFQCPLLSNLARLLREKYDARQKMILRTFPNRELLRSEYEIMRIQRLITPHRRHCPSCELREGLATVSVARQRPFPREAPSFPIDLAS